MKIEALVTTGIAALALGRIVRWVMEGKLTPDPWGPEIEEKIQDPRTAPVCHRCFALQEHDGWFCPECGTAVGPYNNYLPFINIFSEGEVMRAGVMDHVRQSPMVVVGFVILSMSAYLVFAPLYWYFLFKNFRRNARLIPESTDNDQAEQNPPQDA